MRCLTHTGTDRALRRPDTARKTPDTRRGQHSRPETAGDFPAKEILAGNQEKEEEEDDDSDYAQRALGLCVCVCVCVLCTWILHHFFA